jgi:hypothetical protein
MAPYIYGNRFNVEAAQIDLLQSRAAVISMRMHAVRPTRDHIDIHPTAVAAVVLSYWYSCSTAVVYIYM